MASGPKIKPGIAGILIGIAMMFLGLGSCIGGIVWGGLDIANAIDGIDRVSVPATQEYDFEENASGIIFAFAPSSSDAKSVTATLTDPSGNPVELGSNTSFTGDSSSSNGDAVELLGTFDAKAAGKYTLAADGPAGAQVAIANISMGAIATKMAGGAGGGILLGLIGFILMIVTMVRRSKAKKNMAMNPGGFSGGPGAMPGQMPPPPGMAAQMPPGPGMAAQMPPGPGAGQPYPQAPGMVPPAPGMGQQFPPAQAPPMQAPPMQAPPMQAPPMQYPPTQAPPVQAPPVQYPPAPPADEPPSQFAPPPESPGQWGNEMPPPPPPPPS